MSARLLPVVVAVSLFSLPAFADGLGPGGTYIVLGMLGVAAVGGIGVVAGTTALIIWAVRRGRRRG